MLSAHGAREFRYVAAIVSIGQRWATTGEVPTRRTLALRQWPAMPPVSVEAHLSNPIQKNPRNAPQREAILQLANMMQLDAQT